MSREKEIAKVGTEQVELNGFLPVDPWNSPERSDTRRHLPHLQAQGFTYFVTCRCRLGLSLSDEAKDIVMSRHWDASG